MGDTKQGNDKLPISFSDIATALAGDYTSLYVINSDNDSYVEYTVKSDNKELIVNTSGEDFYSDVVNEVKLYVFPDDQDGFINLFDKEKLNEILLSGISFSHNYRIMENGKPIYHYLKIIRGNDHNILIGVKDVDEEVRRKLDADKQIRTFGQIANALASRYEVIYYVNIENNKYTTYSASDVYSELGTDTEGEDFFKTAEEDIKRFIHSADKDNVLDQLKKDTLYKNLKESGAIRINYRQKLGDDYQWVSMIVVHPRNDSNHFIVGVVNIDKQMKREQSMLEESEIYNEIAMALAAGFVAIYHVNIETNEYTEYNASGHYKKSSLGSQGKDFFVETKKNMEKDIYPEDLPMMSVAMDKDYILNNLDVNGSLQLNYRLMIDGKPNYMTLSVIRSKKDFSHIIIAVANVDDAKRKELEFEKAIDSAIDIANKDALTGVKNKHAYTKAVGELDKNIKDLKANNISMDDFALLVCDINGLKIINDTKGHSAGDEYIREACRNICQMYKHSPVYRIGGDEFVVILRGGDFEKREELIEEFEKLQSENKRKGLVTSSIGMAVFKPEQDSNVNDVFVRADKIMYENKKLFKKNMNNQEKIDQNEKERKEKSLIDKDEAIVKEMLEGYPEKRKEKLDKLYEAFAIVAEGTYVYLCDMRYDISRWSKNAITAFGLPAEYMHGAGEIWEHKIHPEDIAVYHSEIDSIFKGETSGHDMQYRARKINGEYVICTCRGTVLIDNNGEAEYFAGSIRNQSSQEHIDTLTGLSNQYGFLESLQNNMVREKNMEITLLGISRFAEFNNVYGYHFGNKILQRFARHLYEFVASTGSIYRLDGTKFVVMSNTYNVKQITEKYEELRRYCRTNFEVDEKNIILDLNAGHISVTNFDVDPQTVYACLSYAYSESKLHKQGDMVFFINDSNNDNSERIEMLHYIRGSIMRNYEGFYLLYQPVVDSKTEKLIGAEALIRWKDDRYGTVPPDQFIPLLERDPLFPELGEWILRTALSDARKIMKYVPDFTVNVNLSYTQLEKGGFVDMVLNTLKEEDFPPDHLCLEITERCRLLDMDILKNVIVTLRSYGVKFALDDFGTGFSSIGLVKNLPLDTIKIDRSFVQRIEVDEKEKALVENFVNVAATFGAKVCIEGIETAGMKEILQKYRVQSFQGYYYAKPLNIVELEKMVKE